MKVTERQAGGTVEKLVEAMMALHGKLQNITLGSGCYGSFGATHTMTASAACLLQVPIAQFQPPPTSSIRTHAVLLIGTSLLVYFGAWVWLVIGGYDNLLPKQSMRILLGISLLVSAGAHSWYGWMIVLANRVTWVIRPAPLMTPCPSAANLALQLVAAGFVLPALFLLDIIPKWVSGSGVTLGILWSCDAAVLTLVCRVIATCRASGCFRPPQAPPNTAASPGVGALNSSPTNVISVEGLGPSVEMQTMQKPSEAAASTSTRLPPSSLPELRRILD